MTAAPAVASSVRVLTDEELELHATWFVDRLLDAAAPPDPAATPPRGTSHGSRGARA